LLLASKSLQNLPRAPRRKDSYRSISFLALKGKSFLSASGNERRNPKIPTPSLLSPVRLFEITVQQKRTQALLASSVASGGLYHSVAAQFFLLIGEPFQLSHAVFSGESLVG
jgi:hypothetical protein